jgi:hypothetical protein
MARTFGTYVFLAFLGIATSKSKESCIEAGRVDPGDNITEDNIDEDKESHEELQALRELVSWGKEVEEEHERNFAEKLRHAAGAIKDKAGNLINAVKTKLPKGKPPKCICCCKQVNQKLSWLGRRQVETTGLPPRRSHYAQCEKSTCQWQPMQAGASCKAFGVKQGLQAYTDELKLEVLGKEKEEERKCTIGDSETSCKDAVFRCSMVHCGGQHGFDPDKHSEECDGFDTRY